MAYLTNFMYVYGEQIGTLSLKKILRNRGVKEIIVITGDIYSNRSEKYSKKNKK